MSGRSRRWRWLWAELDCSGTLPHLSCQRSCWLIWKHSGENVNSTLTWIAMICICAPEPLSLGAYSIDWALRLACNVSWSHCYSVFLIAFFYFLLQLFNKREAISTVEQTVHFEHVFWWFSSGQMLWLAGLPSYSHSLCLWCMNRSTQMTRLAGSCRTTSWSSILPYTLSDNIQTLSLRRRDSYRRYASN